MYYIYCYTNKTNNKKYVGQTNCLERRKREHRSNAFNPNSKGYNLLFHTKIRQYGEENFDFTVLETIDTEDKTLINSREIFWIEKLKTFVHLNQGYNLTKGGDSENITSNLYGENISKIKQLIKQGVSFSLIKEKFNISISHLSSINHGYYYNDPNENYPLYRYYKKDSEYDLLVDLLKNSNKTLKDIAEELNIGYSTVKKINSGALRKGLSDEYPIRKMNIIKARAIEVQKMLLENKLNIQEIAQHFKVSQITIERINRGETHKDSTLNYPLSTPVSTIQG